MERLSNCYAPIMCIRLAELGRRCEPRRRLREAAGTGGASRYAVIGDIPVQYRLEQFTGRTAVAKAAMPGLGEGGMVRHPMMYAEVVKPAVREVLVDFFEQPFFQADAVGAANNEHADDQFLIN